MENKKSQIFMLDFITAVVLFVISITIFFSYYYISDPTESLFDVVFDLSDTFSSLQINKLNNDYVRSLFIEQKINDIDNTILQQISDFHERGMPDDAQNLTKEITNIYITEQVGYSIMLDDSITQVLLDNSSKFGSRADARNIAVIQRQIIGIENVTPYVHVYTFEVWRK